MKRDTWYAFLTVVTLLVASGIVWADPLVPIFLRRDPMETIAENQQEQLSLERVRGDDYLVNPTLADPVEQRYFEEEMLAEELELEENDWSIEESEEEAVTSWQQMWPQSGLNYRLQVGDKLHVSIYGEGDTGRAVVVDSTGSIHYLLVGRVHALGKTVPELRDELEKGIRNYFRHAVVAVTPIEFGSQHYTILGEIRSPGKKLLQGRMSLLEAIAEAGGLKEGFYRTQTVELSDLSHAFLARDGDYIPVDFEALITQGDLCEDVYLCSGDYIYIPNSLEKEIHVLGEVRFPTTLGYVNTVSLVEAIAQARGLTDRASSRCVVIRGSLNCPMKYLIDINLILRGCEPDFLLQPGDIVYAPPRQFTELRDIVRLGIRAFVAGVGAQAGRELVRTIDPDLLIIDDGFGAPVFVP